MTIKELKKYISELDDNADFVVSADEELNIIFGKWEVAELEGEENTTYCIYGFSGSEIELTGGFEEMCAGCGKPILENQSKAGDRHSTCI